MFLDELPSEIADVWDNHPKMIWTHSGFTDEHLFTVGHLTFIIGYDLIGDPEGSDYYTGDPDVFVYTGNAGRFRGRHEGTVPEIAAAMREFFDMDPAV